ncbi:MAG: SCO family protein [Nocardiopsaceae bacterium]|nr:SCO family protein [Nocardiopsaceae bacterium]
MTDANPADRQAADERTADGRTRESPRRGRHGYGLIVAVVAAVAVVVAAALVTVFALPRASGGQPPRPSGIPASVSDSQASLMDLQPLPPVAAPGFTLTDQHGRTVSLSQLRGKVVVLEFMDPHCTDICPIVSAEFLDAYRDLGAAAGNVVFAAINVNQYHATVADMLAYSTEHDLDSIPGWRFLTGPLPRLRAAWRDYHISVQAPSPSADIVHTSAIYFIAPDGRERFEASPTDDHTANGTAYLPADQLTAWGKGIAHIARLLAR